MLRFHAAISHYILPATRPFSMHQNKEKEICRPSIKRRRRRERYVFTFALWMAYNSVLFFGWPEISANHSRSDVFCLILMGLPDVSGPATLRSARNLIRNSMATLFLH